MDGASVKMAVDEIKGPRSTAGEVVRAADGTGS
jgi:hypothetical protein